MQTTILIIEPDKSTLSEIKQILIKQKFEIICASTPVQGIKLLSQVIVDIILCDVELPNTSGLKFLNALLKNNENKHIPTLFITSKANKKEIETATSLGADGFIFKPINPKLLTEAVERILLKYTRAVAKHRNRDEGEFADAAKEHFKYSKNDFVFRFVNKKPAFIKIYTLKYFAARGVYLTVFLSDGSSYKTRRSISELERKLPKDMFIRIHRSTIININYIEKVERWFNNTYRVFLQDIEKPFETSRRYASLIRSRF